MTDRFDWCLRMFLSVDLVGSTQFKSQSGTHVPSWIHVFEDFYKSFPTQVRGQYEKLQGLDNPSAKPEVWKFVGDEILFEVELKQYRHALSHIVSFREAARAYKQHLKGSAQYRGLDLKCGAWIAGFPIRNAVVSVSRSGDAEKSVRDYLGPAIDAGFRILKEATPHRFVVSPSLALLLLDACHHCNYRSIPIVFDGKREFKGVLGGEPYPVIWLPVGDEAETEEDKLLGIKRETKADQLCSYLRNLHEIHPQFNKPFVNGDDDLRYSKIPTEFERERTELMEKAKNEELRGYAEQPDCEPTEGARPLAEPKRPTLG